MSLTLKPAYLKRYKDIVKLLLRHGRHDLVATVNLDEALIEDELDRDELEGDPESLADDLEKLGPTFIKLGQMLSTRSDLFPKPYLEALSRLQDKVEPFPFDEAKKTIEDELGVRVSRAFERIDPEPIAAASLGQVHRGWLRDGRAVVVKIQRPAIRRQILDDLDALDELAELADASTDLGRRFAARQMLTEFRKTLLRELDYRQEAQHLVTLGANLAGYPRLLVPQPIRDYSSSRVLTMEFVEGRKITDVGPLARLDVDGEALTEELIRAYLDQILVDGFFHADPHPGNVFLTRPAPEADEPPRLALLDLGMVAHLDERRQEQLLKLLLAISEGRGSEVADLTIGIGHRLPEFDRDGYTRAIADLVARYQHSSLAELRMGRIMMEVTRAAGEHGLRPAPELTMLGKTLLNLDAIGRTLAPECDPNRILRAHANSLLEKRMRKKFSPGALFATMMEMGELVQTLPSRMNRLLDAMARDEFELRLRAFDEDRVMRHFHRIANRIAIALVLAALIVGAALMMRVETSFTIWGYPGLAMIFFLMAAACGFALVGSILLSERRDQDERR